MRLGNPATMGPIITHAEPLTTTKPITHSMTIGTQPTVLGLNF
jgi:hypothetical protein